MTFPNNTLSATPAKYLFRLISGATNIICDPEPLEWASGTLEINRDIDVGGVFSSFQVDTLTFVGNGAKLLRKLFEAKELAAECEFAVYYWRSTTREYVEFPTRFNIDFNFYEVVKVGKFAFGIKVKAINNSFQTKIDNRSDIEVNLPKLTSVGEKTIQDYANLKKYLNFDATNQTNYCRLADISETGGYDLPRKPGFVSYIGVPLLIKTSDFTEAQETTYVKQITNLTTIKPFFKSALFDYTFDLSYQLAVEVISDNVSDQWEAYIYETKDIGSPATTSIVNTYFLGSWGSEPESILLIEGELTGFTMTKGNDLKLVIQVANTTGLKSYLISSYISINQPIISSPALRTEGFPIYEAFERTLQHITDSQYPFYSEFFGRTDVLKNQNGQYYSTENQLRFAHIQSGLNLRGITLDSNDSSLAVSFKDLFKTAQAIWNVGYSIEKISDYLKVRIEEYSYFFQDELTLDISSRINKYDIVSAVMPELAYNHIKSGFDNFEYLEINGRGEPNTTNQRTTVLNTNSKYDNVAPLRGDTKGILSTIAMSIENVGSTDTKGDDKIFIVKTQKDGSEWKPERGENITIDDNSLFGDDLLNRYFTPTRMLIRHANRIKAGLTKVQTSYLRFQKSDKLQTLETTGETYSIAENADLLVSSLEDPIYRPIKHIVECYFDWSDLQAIQAKPYGYIKFTDTISGYLLNLKKKNNEAKTEITIIQKY